MPALALTIRSVCLSPPIDRPQNTPRFGATRGAPLPQPRSRHTPDHWHKKARPSGPRLCDSSGYQIASLSAKLALSVEIVITMLIVVALIIIVVFPFLSVVIISLVPITVTTVDSIQFTAHRVHRAGHLFEMGG